MQRTNVATAPDSYKTNVDKVFVTGDMHRGQSLVVWAVREGRVKWLRKWISVLWVIQNLTLKFRLYFTKKCAILKTKKKSRVGLCALRCQLDEGVAS